MKNADLIEKSEWWPIIRQAEEEDLLPLTGDFLLVEALTPPERMSKGGIIIAEVTTHKDTTKDRTTNLGLVLAVGPGQYIGDGSDILKPRFEPGDVILLPNNVEWYDVFFWARLGPRIGRVRDSQIPMGTARLTRLQEIINSRLIPKVES